MPSARPRGKGRVGRPYLRAAAVLRAKHLPCWLCGQAIDYHAKPRSRWSFSLDHEVALVRGGAELDPANHRAAHYGCNSRKGARLVGEVLAAAGYTSPHW